MFINRLASACLALYVCLCCNISVSAQCTPPASIWLNSASGANSLVLTWSASPGISYQIRYWEYIAPGDKTIVGDWANPPFKLEGLRKNAWYAVQIRASCNGNYSSWGPAFNFQTAGSAENCLTPTGVLITPESGALRVSWTSSGAHTIRYRSGTSGDWWIPAGAQAVQQSPFVISGLSPGSYQVEIKHHCSSTGSNYMRFSQTVTFVCNTPQAPSVVPDAETANVQLPSMIGVNAYNVQFREGTAGNWLPAGEGIPPSLYTLPFALSPGHAYQVRIQSVCTGGAGAFSQPTAFQTLEAPECLLNKNYGINLGVAEIAQLNERYNSPSPYTLGSMIGVNDGGLIFRSFQNAMENQITRLSTQLRIFHTMDEDFDLSIGAYDQNVKPKDTQPEGTPENMGRNQAFYKLYRQIHGFDKITAATEILQYSPQSWKDKIYRESDWSVAGPAGTRQSFSRYAGAFIQHFAPPSASEGDILAGTFQVGNELWDYPVASDYHNLLLGARDAFIAAYGPKSTGNWKMRLGAGAFQAFRNDNCLSSVRDVSNCGGALERHDFIGNYLNVTDCGLLRDLDAIDCHPYSYLPGTTHWVHPEHPSSETWQIRNLAAWRDANQNPANGVLMDARLWATEFGFDSNPVTGVGEKTQSAYLIRGLFLHSRFHFEKLFFYNAFDHLRSTDNYYTGLYNSSGFWRMGTSPHNSAWPSPLEADGATPKPSWFGMLDLKDKMGDHVFYKALVEDSTAFMYLLARHDGSDPYLVFWSPQATNDGNVDSDITIQRQVTWAGVLPGSFTPENTVAYCFAEAATPAATFFALESISCNQAVFSHIRRMPAYVRLLPCDPCINVTDAGSIAVPIPDHGDNPFDPGSILSTAAAQGGNGGNIQYQWQQSADNDQFATIPDALSASYNPPVLTQTIFFRRGARRSSCADFVYTPSVKITVQTPCPKVLSFLRMPHFSQECNPSGDYYFELTVTQISTAARVSLENLPLGGIRMEASSLNDVRFSTSSFLNNLLYMGPGQLDWLLNPANGATQTLKLNYCWSANYPDPVETSSATVHCSNIVTFCASADDKPAPESRTEPESAAVVSSQPDMALQPNPGNEQLLLRYTGKNAEQASLRIWNMEGQPVSDFLLPQLVDGSQWIFDTGGLRSGMYFLILETGTGVVRKPWQKLN